MTERRRGRGTPEPESRRRLNLGHRRYHTRDVPHQVTNALLHLGLARRAARRRARDRARREYVRSLRCWRRANVEQTGRWQRELLLVAREYVSFALAAPEAGGAASGPGLETPPGRP